MVASTPPTAAAASGVATRVAAAQGIGTVGGAYRSLALPFVLGLLLAALTGAHLLALHQGPTWASPLLIGDHLFSLVFALTIPCYALALGNKLIEPVSDPYDDGLTRNLTALALGAGVLSLAILGLGLLRLYYGFVFLAAGLGLTIWLRGELARIWIGTAAAIHAWTRAGMPTAPTRLQRAVLLILLLALATTLVRATNPVASILVDWDAAAYHLAGPKIYITEHRFMPLPNLPLTNAPSGEEMLFVVGLLAGVESLGKVLAVYFALALGAATYALARRHFDSRSGWLAVLLLFSSFWLVILLPLTVTDFAETFFIMLGVSDLFAWLSRQGTAKPVGATQGDAWWARAMPDDRLLIRAGLLFGFAVSFKLTAIPILPTAVLTLVLARLCIGSAGPMRRLLITVRGCTILGSCTLLTFSPWPLKNLYFFRQAFYPVAVATSDPRLTEESGTTTQAASMTIMEHIWWLVNNVLQFTWHFVGPLSICLLAVPLVANRVAVWASFLFLSIGSIIWFTIVPPYSPRYYLPLVAVAEVVIAVVLLALLERLRSLRLLGEIGLLAYLAASATWAFGTGLALMFQHGAFDQARGALSTTAYVGALARPYQAEMWINSHTPGGTRVALVGIRRGYYLDRPYLENWYKSGLAGMEASSAQRVATAHAWCQQDIRYAVFDRGDDQTDDPAKAGIRPIKSFAWPTTPGLQARVLFSAWGVDVLAVQPCHVRDQ